MNPYDHPDYKAQLAGILAVPADDLRRLVLADWLDEHGEGERAEFIRVQCELAKLPAECDRTFCDGSLVVCPDCRRLKSLRIRERALLQRGRDEGWFRFPGRSDNVGYGEGDTLVWWPPGDSRGVREEDVVCGDARRGFVASVRCTLAEWCGGTCPDCLGVDGLSYETYLTDCRRCRGMGETTGIGESVVASHPVERVVLTDRRPQKSVGPDGVHDNQLHTRWVWRPNCCSGDWRSHLPLAWFPRGVHDVSFDTLDQALAWASFQALGWARGVTATDMPTGRAIRQST
jgi:uncharacterized protein (TIGR02996 family)